MALDSTSGKSIKEMLPLLAAAEPQRVAEPNFGFTPSTVWGLLRVRNDARSTDFILYFDYNLSYIDISIFPAGRWDAAPLELTSGSMVPQSRKPYRHRLNAIPLSLERGVAYDVVMRIKSHGSLSISSYLYTPREFEIFNERMDFYFGLMFGTLAGLILYILFITVSSGVGSFLYFILFSLAHLLFQSSYNGFLNLYPFAEHPTVVILIHDISAALALITTVLFAPLP